MSGETAAIKTGALLEASYGGVINALRGNVDFLSKHHN